MSDKRNLPIGVFDSGVGGLTVLRALRRRLPRESLLYLGDTARVPYGTKSPETVRRYALENTRLLAERGIKLLVVACNTASAVAMDELRRAFELPMTGVIAPGARAAVAATKSRKVGVIGTAGTVRSGAYATAIRGLDAGVDVQSRACPLFVALAEEGWTDGDVPRLAAEKYLKDFREAGIDTLVLGCTHYPLLAPVISEVMGKGVQVIDSAETTAHEVERLLKENDLEARRAEPRYEYLVTDSKEPFMALAPRFLESEIGGEIHQVSVEH